MRAREGDWDRTVGAESAESGGAGVDDNSAAAGMGTDAYAMVVVVVTNKKDQNK